MRHAGSKDFTADDKEDIPTDSVAIPRIDSPGPELELRQVFLPSGRYSE